MSTHDLSLLVDKPQRTSLYFPILKSLYKRFLEKLSTVFHKAVDNNKISLMLDTRGLYSIFGNSCWFSCFACGLFLILSTRHHYNLTSYHKQLFLNTFLHKNRIFSQCFQLKFVDFNEILSIVKVLLAFIQNVS